MCPSCASSAEAEITVTTIGGWYWSTPFTFPTIGLTKSLGIL
jgi:hypothetical protein